MNKKLILIIGVVLVCLGVIIAQFSDVSTVEICGFAVTVMGAAVMADKIIDKAAPKDRVKTVISIISVFVGSVLLAFAGVSESTLTELIAGVAGLVLLIIGIITSGIKSIKVVAK